MPCRRFLQVQFQSIEMADRVEAFPRLAEREAELLVGPDRVLQIGNEKLRSEGGDTVRLSLANGGEDGKTSR